MNETTARPVAGRVPILFVEDSPDVSYGGSKRVLTGIARHLDRSRWEPHVLVYRAGPYLTELLHEGIPADAPPGLRAWGGDAVLALPAFSSRRLNSGEYRRSRLRHWARDLRSFYRLHYRDRKRALQLLNHVPAGIRLIHFNGPMHDAYEWLHVAHRLKIPLLTHEHGLWRRPPAAFRRVAQQAAAVLCLTPEREECLRRFCGLRVRTRVVSNGVDLQQFRPRRSSAEVRRELEVGPETALLVTGSHFKPWKGQRMGVEAARMLAERSVDFRWVFFGAAVDAAYAAAFDEAVRQHSLQERVIRLSQREDVADLFHAADLMVHTSLRPEPFGMTAVEAMAVGTPVLGPDEGGIPCIVRDGVDGFLYRPADPHSLAEVASRVLKQRGCLKIVSDRARDSVEKHFSIDQQVDRLTSIYESALG